MKLHLRVVLAFWLLLAVVLVLLARPNTAVPGLFYDEALCAGMARDFLTGQAHPHTPGSASIDVGGRPFPTFVQSYGGAVKSWLLLPSFAVFGASQPVLRATALGWGLVSLLVFLLWTRRWLGRSTALVAGALLALDPTFFFVNVLDWGPVFPSFLCRFACFFTALCWWQTRRSLHAFLAGLFAGLGLFNKIDFVVILAGVSLALLCCNAREVRGFLAARRFSALVRPLALASLGFLLTAGPMLVHVPSILNDVASIRAREAAPSELPEKLDTALAMYDGTYFHRLIEHGGRFDQMHRSHPPLFAPLGVALALAAALLLFRSEKPAAFVLLSALFITIGVFALPRAVRIHHMVAVYPFPHLAVALAVTRLPLRHLRLRSAAAALLVALMVGSQIAVLVGTQRLIRETGGRGWWSDALNEFAREVKNRSDLTIVSLDWGFNEQLAFLTDGPTLVEPFWLRDPALARSPHAIHLVHPPEYSLYPSGLAVLEEARRAGPGRAEVRTWRDRQGRVAFYSLRFLEP